jgi:hypothetical protein
VKNKHGPKVVIFVPESLVPTMLQEAHQHLFTGNDGASKKSSNISNYFWLQMDKNFTYQIKGCYQCQEGQTDQ